MTNIVQKENKILRAVAKPIENFSGVSLKHLIASMAHALFAEPDGIGIAAPQIEKSVRVFLVTEDVLYPEELERRTNKTIANTLLPHQGKYMVFINPILKKTSVKKVKDTEGCLSVRGIYGEVARSEKVTVGYFDENGNKKMRGASGLFARVIQHEIDHLNGILFVDKAENIKRFPST